MQPYVAAPGAPPGQEYGTPAPPPYVPPAQDYAAAPAAAGGGDLMPVYSGAPPPMGMQQPGMAPMNVQKPGSAPVHVQPGMQPGMQQVPLGAPGQPQMVQYVQQPGVVMASTGKFSTGLLDCCEGPDAPVGCVISWLLPCWSQGIIGHEVADGVGRIPPFSLTCGLYGLTYIGSCFWGVCYPYPAIFQLPSAIAFLVLSVLGRGKMRKKYGIEGSGLPGTSPPGSRSPYVLLHCLAPAVDTNYTLFSIGTLNSETVIILENRILSSQNKRVDCADCCTVWWCHPCALAQEIRHIRDTKPGQKFELLENREATRTDLDFLKRATAPYF